jgi:general secretion pathway protein F
MPNFRYRAVTQSGEVVSGLISAPTAAEVARRIDYLRLVPIETVIEESAARASGFNFKFAPHARAEDVTIFTLDLALLLKAGARLHHALELLAGDIDIGRLRPTVASVQSRVLAGESLADALSHYPGLFSPMYVALVRVGEASATLENVLHVLARERTRAEEMGRKLADALRYPAFVLFAAACVLLFFLTFVLPQFSTVLRDFGAEIDPVAGFFIGMSEFILTNSYLVSAAAVVVLGGATLVARHPGMRASTRSRLLRLPFIRPIFTFHRTALFCRNLDALLAAGVPLTTTLRILSDTMATMGDTAAWSQIVERVRQGGKLSAVLAEAGTLPDMAVRMLRLGEETNQLATLAGRVAEFYETKLKRSLDRVIGLVGPVAIVAISVIVGGLIVSVMTSLLSVSQLVG